MKVDSKEEEYGHDEQQTWDWEDWKEREKILLEKTDTDLYNKKNLQTWLLYKNYCDL